MILPSMILPRPNSQPATCSLHPLPVRIFLACPLHLCFQKPCSSFLRFSSYPPRSPPPPMHPPANTSARLPKASPSHPTSRTTWNPASLPSPTKSTISKNPSNPNQPSSLSSPTSKSITTPSATPLTTTSSTPQTTFQPPANSSTKATPALALSATARPRGTLPPASSFAATNLKSTVPSNLTASLFRPPSR